MPDGTENGRERFRISRTVDLIAVLAFILSIVGVGWQGIDRFVGAEIQQLVYAGYLVEFRCNSGSDKRCWDGDGHLVVVLPVFFGNTGATDYSESIERVTLELLLEDSSEAVSMLATAFWHGTQNTSAPSTPFRPIVIGGRSSGGHELRFVGTPKGRMDWSDFVDGVINGNIRSLTLQTTTLFSIETDPISKDCSVVFREKHKSVLQERKNSYWGQDSEKNRKKTKKYLTTYCG